MRPVLSRSARIPRAVCALALVLASLPAMARDGTGDAAACHGFKWTIPEVTALFATAPTPLQAGTDATRAPAVSATRLYALDLPLQSKVSFAAPVGKVVLADGAHAGLVRFTPAVSGTWLIALDRGAWIDVVADGKRVESVDFSGSEGCNAPRKTVLYRLEAGVAYLVQFSAADATTLSMTITPGPIGTP